MGGEISTSGFSLIVGSTRGVKPCLCDHLSILIEVDRDIFLWISGGVVREVHPPGSTEALEELVRGDVYTWRISLQTSLSYVMTEFQAEIWS